MKYLSHKWKSRSFIILSISLLFTALLWTVSLSEWATTINMVISEPHSEPNISPLLIGVISLVKVTLLTLIPAVLCFGIMTFVSSISRFLKFRSHNMKLKS